MGELIMASAPIFNDSISFSLLRSCAFTSGKSTSQPIHQLPLFNYGSELHLLCPLPQAFIHRFYQVSVLFFPAL